MISAAGLVSQLCSLRPSHQASSPATIRPSLLVARPSAESAQHADSQLCSVPTVPSTLGYRSTNRRCLHRSARLVREWLSQGHRAAAMQQSPSVLCSCHWLHDTSGKLPMLLLLHAKHPQALVERVPTSGTSENSTTSALQALYPSLDFRTLTARQPSEIFSPKAWTYNAGSRSYASSFASMSPEKLK